MIVKQLTGTGQMLTHYLQTCQYAYNSFASQTLNDLSPFPLMFGRPPKVLSEINPQEGTSGSFN